MIPIGVHPLQSCDLTIEVKGKIGSAHPSVQSAGLRSTARQRFGQASILYDHNVDTTCNLPALILPIHSVGISVFLPGHQGCAFKTR